MTKTKIDNIRMTQGEYEDYVADARAQHKAGWECPRCHLKRESDGGPDPCLGLLPSVKFACCGHGGMTGIPQVAQGYIFFHNGTVLRFERLTEVTHGELEIYKDL